MSSHDAWIRVPVPRRGDATGLQRLATTAGLALVAWGDRRADRPSRSIDLRRVDRPAAAPRPFC